MRIKNIRRISYEQLLAQASIFFSFTGSGIVIFSFFGIAITPFRICGLLCLLSFVHTITRRLRLSLSRYHAFFLLTLLYMTLISTIFSPRIGSSLKLILDYSFTFASMALIIRACRSFVNYKRYLFMYNVALTLTCMVSVFEFVTGSHLAANYADFVYSSSIATHLLLAPTAFLFNPNNLGVLMMISIPVVLQYIHFIVKDKNKKAQTMFFIWALVLLILIPIVTLMTGSRGALVGCAVLFALFFWILNIGLWKKLVIFSLAAVLLNFGSDFINNQLHYGDMISNGSISIFHLGDGGRSQIISATIEQVIKERFVFGAGAGGSTIIVGSSPHNFILELLGDFGIIGLCVLLLGVLSLLRITLKTKNKNMKILFLMSLLAFVFSFFIPPTLMMLHFVWITLSFIYAYTSLKSNGEY